MKKMYYLLIIVLVIIIIGVSIYQMAYISGEECDAKRGRYVDIAFSTVGCYENETNAGRVGGDILCKCICCIPK